MTAEGVRSGSGSLLCALDDLVDTGAKGVALVWHRAMVDRWCGKVGVDYGAISATLSP